MKPTQSSYRMLLIVAALAVAGVIAYKLLPQHGSTLDPSGQIDRLIDEGVELCKRGQFDPGIERIEKARTWAGRAKLHSYAAHANYLLGAFKLNRLRAEHAAERAASERNGRMFSLPRKGLEAVEAHVDAALAVDARMFEALHVKGQVYSEMRQFASAITWFDKALAVNDRFAQAFNDKGEAYFHLQQYELARENFTRAKDIDSSFAEAYLNLAILQSTDANEETLSDSLASAARNFQTFLDSGKGDAFLQELARTNLKTVNGRIADLKGKEK